MEDRTDADELTVAASAAPIGASTRQRDRRLDGLPSEVVERFALDALPFGRPGIPTSDLLQLRGKRALVTGGGGDGLGHAICHRLAEQGAAIAVLDVSAEAARLTADEVSRRWGVQAVAVCADVGNAVQVATAVASVEVELGGIDILVNNAGGALDSNQAFDRISLDSIDRAIRLNLYGVLHVTKAVIDQMLERGAGRIINISSEGALIGMAGSAIYNACKAGVNSFTQSLAHEIGPRGITVVTVCPGLMVAGRQVHLLREAASRDRMRTMQGVFDRATIGRCSIPDEVASVVAFLASPAGGYVHGTSVSVGGGISG